ncbi:F-box protein SKIP23 [Melia azedarach]|uniref:F-box protein SKIP23 n=1 Tax=Melia azedarach TaxID=155640 RepID=A0ACC1Y047_MELAZ|nr:F-box protein SKIP23 [Melia azedarach]
MADWSELPKDLLGLIVKHQDTSFDVFRFRQVCSTWRSSVTPKHRRLPRRFPLIPTENSVSTIPSPTFGFCLSKRTVFLIRSPEGGDRTDSIGTSWLIKVKEDASNRKHLLNPLKRQRFDFSEVLDIQNLNILEIGHEYVLNYVNYPPNSINEACNWYMEKLILMYTDKKSGLDRFVLLTIHVSGKLALYKSENKEWIILEHMPSPYDDVILYKGQFYAVDNTGRTVFVDHLCCYMSLVANPVFGGDKKYLVECKGDLLLVDMYLSIDATVDSNFLNEHELQFSYCMSERTVMFKVFRLNWGRKEWIEVKNLGNDVLFLGEDCVFSASAGDLSVSKGNCIIFVDNLFYLSGEDDEYRDHGVGIFDLESGCIKPLGNDPELSKLFWPPPSWITPTMLEQV